jgi:hypothetical protein
MLYHLVDRLIESVIPPKCGNREYETTLKACVKRRKDRTPPQIPSIRRQISISYGQRHRTLHLPWTPRSEAITQTCSFLAKLPFELRLHIYRYAIGDSTIHMVELKQRLAHVECSKRKTLDIERACIPHGDKAQTHPTWSDDQLGWDFDALLGTRVALLQTCRQIYAEAIDLLYSTNVFDFATAETFNFFVRTILPIRLATIRSLSIGLFTTDDVAQTIIRTPRNNTPYHPYYCCNLARDWDPMWETIKTKMYGLKHLHVVLYGPEFDDPKVQEMLAKPIDGLKGLDMFDLEIRKGIGRACDVFDYTLVEFLPSTTTIVNQACIRRTG